MNADKAICLDELACKRKKARVMRTRLPGGMFWRGGCYVTLDG